MKQIRLSFDRARLKVSEDKTTFEVDEPLGINVEPLTIDIFQEKKEVFELSKSKDRLSVQTLQEIVRTAHHYAIPLISN